PPARPTCAAPASSSSTSYPAMAGWSRWVILCMRSPARTGVPSGCLRKSSGCSEETNMDRNLALEVVRVTEAAALSCARLMGRGDPKGADHCAVEAMRRAFESVAVRGTVVIGEGERDEAPMLFIGEKVGAGWRDGAREDLP